MNKTYLLTEHPTTGQKAIKCLVYNMTSYHPKDIEYKYCDHCHKFHEQK